MIASGWKKQRIPKGQHRLGNHPRVETDEQNEAGVVPRDVSKSREPDGLRRPQEEDEYWSTSPTTWSITPYARREMLSHVGRINETSEGQQALDGDCGKCADAGAECMVYRDHGALSCSRCRFRGFACSHQAATLPPTKKRKRARFASQRQNKSKKT
jgi:hypothetical protein